MLINQVHIVGSPETEYGYQILIEGDFISNVELSSSQPAPGQIEFKQETIVFPGLINSHEHLTNNTHPVLGKVKCVDYTEWAKSISQSEIDEVNNIPFALRYKWGILKNIICGFTTIVQHDSFLNGFTSNLADIYTRSRVIHSLAYDKKWPLKVNWPEAKWKVIHLAEGVSELAANEPKKLLKLSQFPKKILAVHGIKLTPKQAGKLGGLIWCPNSNLTLYGETANVNTLKNEVPIMFGTDSTISSNWNLLYQLHQARKLGMLSDHELFESTTTVPANIFGYSNRGDIKQGKLADVIIAKKNYNNCFDAFYNLNPKDILMVVKSGRIVFFDESLHQQLTNEKLHNSFEEIMVGGVKKYIDFPVSRISNEIRDYYSSLRTTF